jgi:AmiR/NasT family two-component response regulator
VSDAVVQQLEGALSSRIVIEQAKGVIAHTRGVAIDDAFTILRGYARSDRMSVSAAATAIVERRLVL